MASSSRWQCARRWLPGRQVDPAGVRQGGAGRQQRCGRRRAAGSAGGGRQAWQVPMQV